MEGKAKKKITITSEGSLEISQRTAKYDTGVVITFMQDGTPRQIIKTEKLILDRQIKKIRIPVALTFCDQKLRGIAVSATYLRDTLEAKRAKVTDLEGNIFVADKLTIKK